MINIQAQMKELFGGSCLAYCYAAIATGMLDAKKYIKDLTNLFFFGWRHGWIDNDGYVSKPVPYLNGMMQEKVIDIRKHYINDLSQLPEGNWIVEYRTNPDDIKTQHFVIANRDSVIFDPSGDSLTVMNGKPFSYREIVLA